MNLVFGSYNTEFGGIDSGDDARLRRQLEMLAAVQADVWAFQECTGWFDERSKTQGMIEDALGMRGFHARSHRAPGGGDVALFIRESAGLRFIEPRNEDGVPWWHGVAHITCELEGAGRMRFASAHLAPASPRYRELEAESFQLIAEKEHPVIAGGDWNAFPLDSPETDTTGIDPAKARRKADTGAAHALEEHMTDAGRLLGVRTPTVGHTRNDKLAYQCDRIYTTLPAPCITEFKVILEDNPNSDHRPVVGTFQVNS